MIFGNIKDLNDYPFLEEGIRKAFAYTASHDLLHYKKGSSLLTERSSLLTL